MVGHATKDKIFLCGRRKPGSFHHGITSLVTSTIIILQIHPSIALFLRFDINHARDKATQPRHALKRPPPLTGRGYGREFRVRLGPPPSPSPLQGQHHLGEMGWIRRHFGASRERRDAQSARLSRSLKKVSGGEMRGQHHRVVASSNHHCCRKFVFDALHHPVQFSREVHTISRREPGFPPLSALMILAETPSLQDALRILK